MSDQRHDHAQVFFRLTPEPLSQDALIAQVTRPDCGAVAAFAGIVRGMTQKDGDLTATEFLVYEAYAPMARKESLKVADEVLDRWPAVRAIAMEHRVGRCELGEPTVMVAVATPHRHDGCFEACRFAIDRLKAIVPIWKQDNREGQQEWLEGVPQEELDMQHQMGMPTAGNRKNDG